MVEKPSPKSEFLPSVMIHRNEHALTKQDLEALAARIVRPKEIGPSMWVLLCPEEPLKQETWRDRPSLL